MLTDQELQSLRNMGNEAENAADEIMRLREGLALMTRDRDSWIEQASARTQDALDLIAAERERCAKSMEAEINRLAVALQAVADLHPEHDSKEGFNEWGEADCFNQAQALARKALGIVA